MGTWLLDRAREELRVIREAPLTVVIFFALGLVAAWTVLSYRLDRAKEEVETYRAVLGISDASKGELIRLSNDDLKAKTFRLVRELRDIHQNVQKRSERATNRFLRGEITKEQNGAQQDAFQHQANTEFTNSIRTEVLAVNNELRRRLSPEAKATIVMAAPELNIAIWSLGPAQSIFFIETIANELEAMAQILPPSNPRPWLWPVIIGGVLILALIAWWSAAYIARRWGGQPTTTT